MSNSIMPEYNPRVLKCGIMCVRCAATLSAPSPSTKRYLKPKLKTVSTKLSEFPHHTTYHTIIHTVGHFWGARPTPSVLSTEYCLAYLGAGLPFGPLDRILPSIPGCWPPLRSSRPDTGDYFTPLLLPHNM